MDTSDKVILTFLPNGEERLYWKCAYCKGIHSIPVGEKGWKWNQNKSFPIIFGSCIVLPCNGVHLSTGFGKYLYPLSFWTEEEIQSVTSIVEVKDLTGASKGARFKALIERISS